MTSIDPRARVGDTDREQTVALLQRYTAEGYLTLDEFSGRSAAAYRATTHGELAAVTEDLVPQAAHPATRDIASRMARSSSWSPVMLVAAGVAGVVVVVVVMAVVMLAMMGGMDMGGMP